MKLRDHTELFVFTFYTLMNNKLHTKNVHRCEYVERLLCNNVDRKKCYKNDSVENRNINMTKPNNSSRTQYDHERD